MEEVLEARSIVLKGSWNTRILTPDWIDNLIFQKGELELQFPFDPVFPIRISDRERMTIVISNSRIILQPQTLSEELLVFISDAADKLLNTLPHTPFNAIGINFGFKENSPLESINDYLEITNKFGLSKISGLKSRKVLIIRRTLLLSRNLNERILNFEIIKNIESQEVNFNFNYHKDISDAKLARKLLAPGKLTKLHSFTTEFLRKFNQ